MMTSSYAEQQPINDGPPPSGPGNVARLVDRLSKDISTTHGKGVPIKPPKPNNNNSRTAQVRFSYLAQQEDELTLEEDDVIEVIEDVEDGWARGKLKDKVGLFPTNFVSFTSTPTSNTTTYSSTLSRVNEEPRKKVSTNKEEPPVSNGKTPVDKTPSTGSNVLPSSFKASVRKNGPNSNNGTSTTTAVAVTNSNSSNKSPKEYAKVLYEYKAINPDELDLREGEIVTVINRRCTDEGWCLGELNGKRGLFPENFVKISSTSAGPSPAMSASGSTTAPPVLPAKPLKTVSSFVANKMPETTASSNTTTTASVTSTPSAQTTNTISTDSTATNPHKQLEERKSVVAGIQSRLFPQGKFPPHKPTFQPPSNVLTTSQHGSARGNVDSDSVPVVQMRHSVVDPTKLGLSSVYFDDQHLSDVGESGEEPKQLESLTKLRPKQNNKRPPSTQFRSSKVIKPESPPGTPPLTPTTNAPSSTIETVAVSTGPATTSFPAESRSPAQQASPNTGATNRTQEVHNVVKEINSIATTVNSKSTPSPTGQNTMGQKPSRNHSAGSTHSNFYAQGPTAPVETDTTNEPISRAEFNEFRSEILRRLAKLEEKILQLDVSSTTTKEPGERQQHF